MFIPMEKKQDKTFRAKTLRVGEIGIGHNDLTYLVGVRSTPHCVLFRIPPHSIGHNVEEAKEATYALFLGKSSLNAGKYCDESSLIWENCVRCIMLLSGIRGLKFLAASIPFSAI